MPIQKRTRTILICSPQGIGEAQHKDSSHQTKNSHGDITFIQKKAK